ncbi:MAG: type VI secretion system accessory protein TagJ [Planctomycetota bacterium]
MTAAQLFAEGQLAAAIQQQSQAVRAAPSDPNPRIFLLGLLVLAGELSRATTHADLLMTTAATDQGLSLGMLAYQACLRAECERAAIYEGKATPLFPAEAPSALGHRLAALQAAAGGDFAAARAELERATSSEELVQATVNGGERAPLADGDDFLGCTLEVYASGRCVWLPMSQVAGLEIHPPKMLLDLVWARARLQPKDGEPADVHLPVLYAGSAAHADEAVRLGRRTEWTDVEGVGLRGCGQKVFLHGAGGSATSDVAILEAREIEVAREP